MNNKEFMEQRVKDLSIKELAKAIQVKTKQKIKEPEVKGVFDDVGSWKGAISLLEKHQEGWSGKFVEISGRVYFDLEMGNHNNWTFSGGKPLLSKKHFSVGIKRKGKVVWEKATEEQ